MKVPYLYERKATRLIWVLFVDLSVSDRVCANVLKSIGGEYQL